MKPNEPEGSGVFERRIQEVTQANRKFYEAFESLDIAKMDEVWAHLDYVTCVHPGWSLRSEWPAVRDSWVLIFNNTFSMSFELTESIIQVAGDMAWKILPASKPTSRSKLGCWPPISSSALGTSG